MNIQLEKLKDVWDEFEGLCKEHWHETEEYRHGQGLNIDKKRALHYEELGIYSLYVARIDGKMVGNMGMYVMPSMHTQQIIGTEDTLFVLPEHRKGSVGLKLVKYVIDDLRKKGVVELQFTVKTDNRAYLILERLDFTRIAYQYSKHL